MPGNKLAVAPNEPAAIKIAVDFPISYPYSCKSEPVPGTFLPPKPLCLLLPVGDINKRPLFDSSRLLLAPRASLSASSVNCSWNLFAFDRLNSGSFPFASQRNLDRLNCSSRFSSLCLFYRNELPCSRVSTDFASDCHGICPLR